MSGIKCKLLGHKWRHNFNDEHHRGVPYSVSICERCEKLENFHEDAFKPNPRLRNPVFWLVVPLYFPLALAGLVVSLFFALTGRALEWLSDKCYDTDAALTKWHGRAVKPVNKFLSRWDKKS